MHARTHWFDVYYFGKSYATNAYEFETKLQPSLSAFPGQKAQIDIAKVSKVEDRVAMNGIAMILDGTGTVSNSQTYRRNADKLKHR